MTMDLSHRAIIGKAYMWCQNNQDVSVFGNMVTESSPAGITGEGNSCEASEVEDFSPPVSHNLRNVMTVIVMVEFVRARTFSQNSIFGVHLELLQLLEDSLFCFNGS